MQTLASNPGSIDETCKEAVVDSLLNNLSARVSGLGEFHSTVLGTRPSELLVSGFLVSCPEEDRETDEESSPLQLNAQGLDFHLDAVRADTLISANVRAAVYVRIFPNAQDVAEGGQLRPQFSFEGDVSKALFTKTREAEDALRAQLGVKRYSEHRHPDWARLRAEKHRAVLASLGIPYEAGATADMPVDSEGTPAEETSDAAISAANAPSSIYGRDGLYKELDVPQKWLRIELTLPTLGFTPATAARDAQTATDLLNAAIASQLKSWFESSDPVTGGMAWGYRRGLRISPSSLSQWDAFVQQAAASDSRPTFPNYDLRWVVNVAADPLDSARLLVHVALENWTDIPDGIKDKEVETAIFQVSMDLIVEHLALRPLLLERVKPSYRYNQYLHYPALGFNCGVRYSRDGDNSVLTTTWSPRYVLPRIVPTHVDAELRFAQLATPEGLNGLSGLIPAYTEWLRSVRNTDVAAGMGSATQPQITVEREKLAEDLLSWEHEALAIERGLAILQESAQHWSGPGEQKDPRGIPCEAWFAMNAAMLSVGAGKYDRWRLFQLAFIVSSIATFATRIPAFRKYYEYTDVAQQANSVTLLYFATGGGKSEAFLGLLLFVLLLDRLRGKLRGVSALMRYPLRLLTLQQARRTLRILAAGEVQRVLRKHPGEPFSLGFWVGSSNTPNWHNAEVKQVPTLDARPLAEEDECMKNATYASLKEQWLKIESCPFCSSKVALRRSGRIHGEVLGHYCTDSEDKCPWGKVHPETTPLPFYIVDQDIYAIAPSVLLGTVDKLAVIGQSSRTIRHVFGMFGMAPFCDPSTGHLSTPVQRADWERTVNNGMRPLYPADTQGAQLFFDPFPSLLIQDEAHLLEESLGTFAGLFESALDAGFDRLAPLLRDQISREPGGERRRVKVIAASATVSEPQRQMRNLYQRNTIQFPHPGPDLYRSFYAEPKEPTNLGRLALPDIERRAHGARTYAAILTNGHRHTVAMASILGQYHLLITELYEGLRSGKAEGEARVRKALRDWLSRSELRTTFSEAIDSASCSDLLTLIDLHRIALTYVTNKKGGDQLIDTERNEFDALHAQAGLRDEVLQTELISGAVSAGNIQAIVRRAETRVRPGSPFPELSETLRSIIATSAVSHGVDVEEFNAMFFAGLPSDIAEYIQASSRVGRTHVGFSLLVPVPQRQRDRFVVEVFDIFHRFLERMVLPAAVDRWAEKAIRRVIPSVLQEYLCGVSRIIEIANAPGAQKENVRDLHKTDHVREYLSNPANQEALRRFVVDALGLTIRPPLDALTYYEALVRTEISEYWKAMNTDAALRNTDLRNFFGQFDQSLRPMTSLRDVDLAGYISPAAYDAADQKADDEQTAQAMSFIRRGVAGELDDEDEDEESP